MDDYYLEPTQKLEDESPEENESTRNDQDVVYGLLTMLDDESNQEFQIFLGENMIGRDRNNCQICIPSASSLSRSHAVIEAHTDGSFTIMDKGSINATFRNQKKLKPNVIYDLENDCTIKCGDISLKFSSKDIIDQKENSSSNENKFLVPETPINKRNPKVDARNSPNLATYVPQSPLQDSLDGSSFISPSQPLNKSTQSPILAKVEQKSAPVAFDNSEHSSMLDMETQAIVTNESTSMLDMETQALNGGETSSSVLEMETQALDMRDLAPKSVLDMETQALGAEETSKSVLDMETQALGAEETSKDVLDMETQALGVNETPRSVLDMNTQAMEANEATKFVLDMETQALGSNEAPKSVLDMETQAMEANEAPKSVFDLGTQALISDEAPKSVFDMETQALGAGEAPKSVLDMETQALGANETPNSVLDMETQAMRSNEAPKSVLDMETQALIADETPKSVLDMETQAMSPTYHGNVLNPDHNSITMNEPYNDNKLFEAETQALKSDDCKDFVKNETLDDTDQNPFEVSSPLNPYDTSKVKNEETYDHTKGSQKMEIDQTLLEQNNQNPNQLLLPTQSTIENEEQSSIISDSDSECLLDDISNNIAFDSGEEEVGGNENKNDNAEKNQEQFGDYLDTTKEMSEDDEEDTQLLSENIENQDDDKELTNHSDDSSDSELIISSQPQVDRNSCHLTMSLPTIKEKSENISEGSENVKSEQNLVEKTFEGDDQDQEREMCCSSPLFNDETRVLNPDLTGTTNNMKNEETYNHTKGSQKMEIDQTLLDQEDNVDSNNQEVDNNISLPGDRIPDQPKKPSPKFVKSIRRSRSPTLDSENDEDEEWLVDGPIPTNKNPEDNHPVFRKDFDLENMKTSSQKSDSPEEDSAELLLSTQELMGLKKDEDEEEEEEGIQNVSKDNENVTNTAESNDEESNNCNKGSQKMEIDQSLNEIVQISNNQVRSSQSTSSLSLDNEKTITALSSNGNSIEENVEQAMTVVPPAIKRTNTNDQIMNEAEKVISRIDNYETNSAETSFNLEANDDAKPKVIKPEQHLNIINKSDENQPTIAVRSEMNIATITTTENDVKEEDEKSEIENSSIRRSNRARRPSAKVRSDATEKESKNTKIKKPANNSTAKGRKSNLRKEETKIITTTETDIDNNEETDAKPKVNKRKQQSDEKPPTIIVQHDDQNNPSKSHNIGNENDVKKKEEEKEKSEIESSVIRRSNRAGRPSAKVRSNNDEKDSSKGKKPLKDSTRKGRKSNAEVETKNPSTETGIDVDNNHDETRRPSKNQRQITDPKKSTTSGKSQDNNTAQKGTTTEPDLVVINNEVENKMKSKIVSSEKSTASKNKGRTGKKAIPKIEAEEVESMETSRSTNTDSEGVLENYSQKKRKTRNQISLEVMVEKKRKIQNEKVDSPIEVIPGPSSSKETENSEVKDLNQIQTVQNSVKKETVGKGRKGTKRPYSEPVTKKDSVKASRSSSMSSNSNENTKPSVRRTISTTTENLPSRINKTKPAVMFTGYENKNDLKIVKDLGGTVTTSVSECTVLVANKIGRTAKLLCALGRGIPIVDPTWISQSKMTKTFLDPWKYLVQDKESEKKYNFILQSSLVNASRTKLLDGYKVFATSSVLPPPKDLKEIVLCAGGQYLDKMPTINDEGTFIISCSEDKSTLTKALKAGVAIQDKEVILTGLLRQKLELDKYKLSL